MAEADSDDSSTDDGGEDDGSDVINLVYMTASIALA